MLDIGKTDRWITHPEGETVIDCFWEEYPDCNVIGHFMAEQTITGYSERHGFYYGEIGMHLAGIYVEPDGDGPGHYIPREKLQGFNMGDKIAAAEQYEMECA